MIQHCFFSLCYSALMNCNLHEKIDQVRSLYDLWHQQFDNLIFNHHLEVLEIPEAGRPDKPELVSPLDVEKRKLSSKQGQMALIHSITHIEFNAINLALDACYRFRNLPIEYYQDWLQVAYEEAYHFELLNNHLKTFGATYGDFTAHNGLWEMALKTTDSPLTRMALVPRLLEARGLDVTPAIMTKFEQIGNQEAVDILKIILRDEIGHVAIGNRWFHYLCEINNLNPIQTFKAMLQNSIYGIPTLSKQINFKARSQAGFTSEELDLILSLA